jgi:curved DNA-binding protein CbpA
MKTLYDLLGVRWDADDAAIRAAFRKAVKAYHPDVNAGDRAVEQRFMEITAAHAVLRDPVRRANYDAALERRRQKLLREWKITLAGWGLSGLLSAGVVGAGVLVLPKWISSPNVVAAGFDSRFAVFDAKKADNQPVALAASRASPVDLAGRANAQAQTASPAHGHVVSAAEQKQHEAARQETAPAALHDRAASEHALAEATRESGPANSESRVSAGHERAPTRGGFALTKSMAGERHHGNPLEAFALGERLANGFARSHVFDREEVDQILGFAETTPEPSIEDCVVDRCHHKHHHHRDRHTAARHGRAPRG